MHGIIAAGALAPAALRELGVERIPLLRINGETLLTRTCRCLIAGGACEVVHVLAPEVVPLPDLPGVQRAMYSGRIVDDALSCIDSACAGEAVLLASGDIPLLTPETIAALRDFALGADADVVYPVVEKPSVEARFPGSKRTYVKLGGRLVTGGNVFWLNRAWTAKRGPLLRQLFERRKDPVGLARAFGLGFVLRLLCGWLDLPYLERHLSRILGGKLRAVVLPFPELAVDLDKLADLETFRPYLDPWR